MFTDREYERMAKDAHKVFTANAWVHNVPTGMALSPNKQEVPSRARLEDLIRGLTSDVCEQLQDMDRTTHRCGRIRVDGSWDDHIDGPDVIVSLELGSSYANDRVIDERVG